MAAVFIRLETGHLIFRNLAGETIRELLPSKNPSQGAKVEWREADSEPASVANVGTTVHRALRIELKLLK